MLGCSTVVIISMAAACGSSVQEREVRHVVGHDATDARGAQRGFPVGGRARGEHRREQLLELDPVLGAGGDRREAADRPRGRRVRRRGTAARTRRRRGRRASPSADRGSRSGRGWRRRRPTRIRRADRSRRYRTGGDRRTGGAACRRTRTRRGSSGRCSRRSSPTRRTGPHRCGRRAKSPSIIAAAWPAAATGSAPLSRRGGLPSPVWYAVWPANAAITGSIAGCFAYGPTDPYDAAYW